MKRSRGRPETPPEKLSIQRHFHIDKSTSEWLKAWAEEHCPHLNGDPNISQAIRMAVELARLLDQLPEYTEIINTDFAGDYRMFVRRAVQDYADRFEEAKYVE